VWLREQLLMQPASPIQTSLLALLPVSESVDVASAGSET